jgi:hypothetical protein
MPNFDREALKRSLQDRGNDSLFRNRVAAQRDARQKLSAATRKFREETIETLEGELKRAGVDVDKFRAALVRHRKRTLDAVSALRPHAAASPRPERAAAAAARGRFRSLQALAGRAVPLNQPSSLTFLNEPLFFTQFGIANVIASSVAPNSTFVSVSFHAAAGGPDSERGGRVLVCLEQR